MEDVHRRSEAHEHVGQRSETHDYIWWRSEEPEEVEGCSVALEDVERRGTHKTYTVATICDVGREALDLKMK